MERLPVSVRPVVYRTQEELDLALDYWQGVLRLRDWEVKATLSPRHVFENEDAQGECSVSEASKFARIYILRQEDYALNAAVPQDHEATLVHELLHIHIHPLEPEDYEERLEIEKEQAVECIATGLIRLKRGAYL